MIPSCEMFQALTVFLIVFLTPGFLNNCLQENLYNKELLSLYLFPNKFYHHSADEGTKLI